MLIRFTVENFKSFNQKQELVMIPGKRLRKKKKHIIKLDKISLLRNATIYGANASGKSNIIEAMHFAKHVITNKIPNEASKMYCRNSKENQKKGTKFEFEIFKNNKNYAYGFSLDMKNLKVITEWAYELIPYNDAEIMLFERETRKKRIELGEKITLNKEDQMKFNTYKMDFEDNKESLFIQEMNRNKKISANSKLIFFKDIFEWFKEDLIIISPDQPITNFEYFYGDGGSDNINNIIEMFDTGISKVKTHEISINDLKNKLPNYIASEILNSFKDKLEEANNDEEIMLSLRSRDAFYNLKGKKGESPIITTIMLEHQNSFSDFEFGEESDGTRRLFDLLDILISNEKNKVYIVDELERSLHPKLTYKFIELFFNLLDENNIQLIFTTHESTIMDQSLLNRDEIWFVERDKNNNSRLYSLDIFNERFDKRLNKAYLEGRYGAVPIFKDYLIEDGVE